MNKTTLEALKRLLSEAERVKAILIQEIGIGVIDENVLTSSRSAIQSVNQEPVALIEQLWNIIDDIDTYGDMAKADDKLFRELVERRQKDRWKTGITTDGYTLTIPNAAPVQPVKQEPVAFALSHSLGLEFSSKFPMCESKERAEELARQHMGQVVVTPLYAAPIDAKAIRAEALEEAAKWFAQHAGHSWSSERITVELEERAAAIRGLK